MKCFVPIEWITFFPALSLIASMPQTGSVKGEHGKNSCRCGKCWEKFEFSLVAVQGIVGCESWDCFPLWEEENMQRWTQKSQRVVQTTQKRLAALKAAFPSVRGGTVRRGRRWGGGPGTCYLSPCQLFLNPLTSAQTLVACIPTYRPDVCQPISEAKAAEPTQDCDPLLPTFCLPAQPWLWIRGRPHVEGQG